jgi:catechol 2,3-dioxygenase-like lactoylglutathione lyase family enzyme
MAGRPSRRSPDPEEDTVTDRSDAGPGVRLRPVVHVEDLAVSLAFYEQLGARVVHGSEDGDRALMEIGNARIGLLAHPPYPDQGEGAVELNFESTDPLEEVEARLRARGATIARPTSDEAFGRQLQLVSPDGLLLKIDELDPVLFG